MTAATAEFYPSYSQTADDAAGAATLDGILKRYRHGVSLTSFQLSLLRKRMPSLFNEFKSSFKRAAALSLDSLESLLQKAVRNPVTTLSLAFTGAMVAGAFGKGPLMHSAISHVIEGLAYADVKTQLIATSAVTLCAAASFLKVALLGKNLLNGAVSHAAPLDFSNDTFYDAAGHEIPAAQALEAMFGSLDAATPAEPLIASDFSLPPETLDTHTIGEAFAKQTENITQNPPSNPFEGLEDVLRDTAELAGAALQNLGEFFSSLGQIAVGGMATLFGALGKACLSAANSVLSVLPDLAHNGAAFAVNAGEHISNAFQAMVPLLSVAAVVTAAGAVFMNTAEAEPLMTALQSGDWSMAQAQVGSALSGLTEVVSTIAERLVDAVTNAFQNAEPQMMAEAAEAATHTAYIPTDSAQTVIDQVANNGLSYADAREAAGELFTAGDVQGCIDVLQTLADDAANPLQHGFASDIAQISKYYDVTLMDEVQTMLAQSGHAAPAPRV